MIKVLCTSAAKRALEEIGPQFERATTHTLHVEFGFPNALVKKVEDGEAFDVLILSTDVEYLIERGYLAANSRTVLGRYGTGIAIPAGASKPEFGSVECFKRTLINAKALAASGEGSSGRFFSDFARSSKYCRSNKTKDQVRSIRTRTVCGATRS